MSGNEIAPDPTSSPGGSGPFARLLAPLRARIESKFNAVFRGMAIAGIGGLSAMWISEHYNAPAMLIALLLGLSFHFLHEDERIAAGIDWVARDVLRIGVALLGMRIAFQDILQAGATGPLVVVTAMMLTIVAGLIGARVLKLSPNFGQLSGGAVAICGVSAAIAISSVLPRKEDQDESLAIVVISVTALSTIAMIIYPVIAGLFSFNDEMAGIFIGGSIHDVAQVIGAGYSISNETGDVATYIKLMRVALLLPIVVIIGTLSRRGSSVEIRSGGIVPSFLIGFLILALMNSFGWIAPTISDAGSSLSRFLLTISIFAIGVRSQLRSIMSVGPQPLILLGFETVVMAVAVVAGVMLVDAF